LFSTGDEEIAEDSPTDSFWGLGPDGGGQNNLGKILMQVRQVLRTTDYFNFFSKEV
ncbi:MAG TPA: NADAR domain-containing protein, partial [Gammaproteobacteria bacterium]|nr:NADAR domain-containing protein [Gammaproteobacteria bacterium]